MVISYTFGVRGNTGLDWKKGYQSRIIVVKLPFSQLFDFPCYCLNSLLLPPCLVSVLLSKCLHLSAKMMENVKVNDAT